MPIIIKSFGSWEFMFLDLVQEISGSLVFQCNFLNLVIEESMFGFLDKSLEFFLILW